MKRDKAKSIWMTKAFNPLKSAWLCRWNSVVQCTECCIFVSLGKLVGVGSNGVCSYSFFPLFFFLLPFFHFCPTCWIICAKMSPRDRTHPCFTVTFQSIKPLTFPSKFHWRGQWTASGQPSAQGISFGFYEQTDKSENKRFPTCAIFLHGVNIFIVW